MNRKHMFAATCSIGIVVMMAVAFLPSAAATPDFLYTPLIPGTEGPIPQGVYKTGYIETSLVDGANYLKHAQADITEDNAGNGDPDIDPDDGGWDWVLTAPVFTHSASSSSTNLFGVTALGLYYAYLKTGDASYMTAMNDVATQMSIDPTIDSAPDLIFLMLYNDLVGGTTWQDLAKAKYDARIASLTPPYSNDGQGLAESIRDARNSQGYPNGIIAWDVGAFAKAAAMLDARYPGSGYDIDADEMAEVLWQDSFNDNPGYFDIVDDAGWDPTYSDVNFWWYTVGITGLIDAFSVSGEHTSEIPGLVSILLDCQYADEGAFSFSYGAHAYDEDWQSTAYAVMTLAALDQPTYQTEINHACTWIRSTQDASGGWVYGSGNHYPEVGGELTSALYFGEDPTEVWVDDDWAGTANGTDLGGGKIFGYNAFATIQDGIDAVAGSTVHVAAGTYDEQITIDKSLDLIGAGESTTTIQSPAAPRAGSVTEGTNTWDYIVAAYPSSGTIDVRIEGFTIDANGESKTTGTDGLLGIFMRDVDGTDAGIYSCTIQNFGTTAYESWGIRVYGDSDLTIDDNTLTDYTRDGIVVNGDDGAGADPDVTVSNNDLTGSSTPLNGIQIGYGATGTISGNTVRDHTRSSPWAAVGIIIKESDGITITGNHIENCFYGMDIMGSDGCTIDGNTFVDNINRHIILDDSDSNVVTDNTITGTSSGTEDAGISFTNGATGNTIGGNIAADGNDITLATSGSGNLYCIYIQSTVGAGSNTIKFNEIYGGKRAVQIDGGNTGTTTIVNNTIGNVGPSFAGIYINAGSATISGNTLTNTVRPIEFWGAVNVDISDNIINGSTFDGINCGSASGTVTISGNEFYNIADWQFAIHGRSGAAGMTIDGNEIYDSHRGISIESGCTGVSITDNYIHDNGYSAMELHETVTTITGNTLDHNKRGIETWSPVTANYNNILFHMYGGVILHHAGPHDAECNWWGHCSGPTHPDNPSGAGTSIVTNGNGIDFNPWLDDAYPGGQPVYAHVETIPGGTQTVNVPGADVTLIIDSTGTTVTVLRYTDNPGSTTFPGLATPFGDYIDISVGDPGAVSWPIYLQINYTMGDLVAAGGLNEHTLYGISFYNDTAGEWQLCSDTGVNTADFDGYAGYVWANLHQGELSPKVIVTWPFPIGGVMFPVNAVGMLVPILSVIALIALIGGTTIIRRRD